MAINDARLELVRWTPPTLPPPPQVDRLLSGVPTPNGPTVSLLQSAPLYRLASSFLGGWTASSTDSQTQRDPAAETLHLHLN
ncbi:hypothetical protein EYF80_037849 [Liparis tanakae]|uniref:Uncharacterized protein n=1 Tax=Liparis tanakae TaxID=230148 RepID=A0A4Z2GH04_9TELE|nr:hypothetical protein EYF80_037849 [Liparis tanakae]